jgi:hypothetical protein
VKIGDSGVTTGIDAALSESGEVEVTPVQQKSPQVITFTTSSSMGNNSSITTSPYSDSSLPVSLSSLTPEVCNVSQGLSNIWTIASIGEGNCKIRATQSGNSQFEAAIPVEREIKILKGQQITHNQPTLEPNPRSGSKSRAIVKVSADSKLQVSLVSLDNFVCEIVTALTSYDPATGITDYTVERQNTGPCPLSANQPGDLTWGPALEKIITLGTNTPQYLKYLSSSPSYSTSFAATVNDFTVTFSSFQTDSTSGTKTNLPVYLRSLTPAVCLVDAVNADGEPISGYSATGGSAGNTTLPVKRVSGASGECIIEGTQDGSDDNGAFTNYLPATPITQTFVLEAAPAKNQILSFDPVPSKTYGDLNFEVFVNSLSEEVDTGLLVTISSTSSNVCSVGTSSRSGAKSKVVVSLLTAGTCSLSGVQSGNSNFNSASTDVTFTVSKRQLTIVGLSGVNRFYDGNKLSTFQGAPSLS